MAVLVVGTGGCLDGTGPDGATRDPPRDGSGAATTREWGTFAGKPLRPGIEVEGCTTNFMFQDGAGRYFLGTAAHCYTTSDPGGAAFCAASEWTPIGTEVLLHGRGDVAVPATIAYNSAAAMVEVGESDPHACRHNDFLLLELDERALDLAHPAVIHFGGPVGLDNGTLQMRDELYFFGNSPVRDGDPFGAGVPGDSELLSPQHGRFYVYIDDGWDFTWAFGPQAGVFGEPTDARATTHPMPGDSGGPFLGPTGNALAVLGGGANSLSHVLAWMEQNWPWSVTLVTWDEFSPQGIEPVRPV